MEHRSDIGDVAGLQRKALSMREELHEKAANKVFEVIWKKCDEAATKGEFECRILLSTVGIGFDDLSKTTKVENLKKPSS